jgi:hypothetical protein
MADGVSSRADYTLYDTLPVSIDVPPELTPSVAQYFWPHCEQTPGRPPFATVRLSTDASAAQQRVTGAGERITLYEAPDGHVPDYNTGAAWQLEAGVRVVHNPHSGSHFTIARDCVYVCNPQLDVGIVDVCRVIKQLAATRFESLGQRVLHAAAVEYNGNTILFVGPKASGKTTLVRAALDAGARFVTNDRLFVDPLTSCWSVRGWSDPMRLVNAPGKKKKLVQLHSYFNGDVSRVCRTPTTVGVVIFPTIRRSATSKVRLTSLDADVALELLDEQILPIRQRWLGIEAEAMPVSRVAPDCPFVSVSAHYYEAAQAFAQVLDTLKQPAGNPTR